MHQQLTGSPWHQSTTMHSSLLNFTDMHRRPGPLGCKHCILGSSRAQGAVWTKIIAETFPSVSSKQLQALHVFL